MSERHQFAGGGFPFTAVVGHEDAKLALTLAAVDPAIGGVLLRGQKGSAKTTLARGLAALLPGQAPFVDLPIGATEDRVIGSIDLAAALTGGDVRFRPGLLADADGGVLYVDEVNLLPDHLVDVLLDVSQSGVNRVERESVSHTHPSRFVLVGSMNPEEGDLRPQLLDRFGLAVDVVASLDPDERVEAVTRRLAFDADGDAFTSQWAQEEAALSARLSTVRPGTVAATLRRTISALCAQVGAEGLRADLTICRAAAALAGLEQRQEATDDDVRRVAPLVLAHRRRRQPFDDPGISEEELEQALDQAADETPPSREDGSDEQVAPPSDPNRVVRLQAPRAQDGARGRRSPAVSTSGRLVGDRQPEGPLASVAVAASVRTAAGRRAAEDPPTEGNGALVEAQDLREAVREQRTGNLLVLAVDASGSMEAERRMEAAKGAVLSLLLDAYQRRDRVALVTFRGESAEVVLRPTASVEVARARLTDVPTGGRTPLAAGIDAAATLARQPHAGGHRPLVVLLTDGRATAGPEGVDPHQAALAAAATVRRAGVPSVVIDAEDGPTRLGMAVELASALGARYLTLPQLSAGALLTAVRQVTD